MHNNEFSIHVRITVGSSPCEEGKGQRAIGCPDNIKIDHQGTGVKLQTLVMWLRVYFAEGSLWIW